MSEYYNPTLPIKVLFDQIEEGMEVAEAASFPQNIYIYLLIIQTGKYKEACIEWNRKAIGNQL